MKQTITIKGMHCASCSMLIREALEDAGARDITIDLNQKEQVGTVTLDTTMSKTKLKEIIENEGEYTVQ